MPYFDGPFQPNFAFYFLTIFKKYIIHIPVVNT